MLTYIILLVIANIIMIKILIKSILSIKWNKQKKIIRENDKEFNELLTFEELLEDDED